MKILIRYKVFFIILLSVLLSFFLFYPSFSGYFTNDDFFLLKISRASGLRQFISFFNPLIGPDGLGMYRPLSTQTFYFLSWKHFDLSPIPLYILSFIVFIGNLLLIYRLLYSLLSDQKAALLSVFLYATSASHFGHFYYLATFQETLMTFFFLLALHFFIKYLKNNKKKSNKDLLLSNLFFVLSLFSKETAVVFPIIAFFTYIFIYKKEKKLIFKIAVIKYFLGYLMVLGIYLYFRIFHYGFAQGDSYIWDFTPRIINSYYWYFLWSLNLPEMLVDYIGPLFSINPNLLKFYSKEFLRIFLLFFLEISILFFVFIKLIIKTKAKVRGYLNYGAIWFLVTLLPVIFLPLHKFSYYLTLPLIGIVLIISNRLVKESGKLVTLFCLAWVLTSFYSLQITRETHWITRGQEISKRVNNYLDENLSDDVSKIIFYDQPQDSELPWSPAQTLKVTLSDNNYFIVFYDDKITAEYKKDLNKSEVKDKDNVLYLKSRQFLGY